MATLFPYTNDDFAQDVFCVPLVMAGSGFWLWRCLRLRRWACEILGIVAWCLVLVACGWSLPALMIATLGATLLTRTLIVCWPELKSGW